MFEYMFNITIREMPPEATMRWHYTSIRMAVIKVM